MLTPAETEEMLRRARIQSAMDAALEIAREDETFAGAYLDQTKAGRPVFLFTKVDEAMAGRLASALPEGANLGVQSAERTERELLDLQARIVGDRDELRDRGITLIRVAIRDSLNTVRIGVENPTDEIGRILATRYGSHVVTFHAEVATSDACVSGPDDCRPMKGGIAIYHSGGLATGECTSGFVVKRTENAALAILTAGHCIQVNGGFDWGWRHDGVAYGRALYETWVPGGAGDADVGLTTLFSQEVAQMTNKNRIRRNNATEASVTASAAPVQGGQACRVGITSGHDCGLITDADDANLSEVAGWLDMNVLHTAVVNFDSLGGDSGGPVFFYPGGGTCCSQVTALGTHVHSEDGAGANEGWFSPYSRGRAAYAALFPGGQTYNLCLTATC